MTQQENPYKSPPEIVEEHRINWLAVIGVAGLGIVAMVALFSFPNQLQGVWELILLGAVWWGCIHAATKALMPTSFAGLHPGTTFFPALLAYFLWVCTCTFTSAPFVSLHLKSAAEAKSQHRLVLLISVLTFFVVFMAAAAVIRKSALRSEARDAKDRSVTNQEAGDSFCR